MIAAGALLALPSVRLPRLSNLTATTADATEPPAPHLTERWPDATIVTTPARLADQAIYTPWFFLDAGTSLGTASTLDGGHLRLLLRGPGEPREIRRMATSEHPQFVGFTAVGDTVFWFQFTATDAGVARTEIWRLDWRTGRPPVPVTADTGAAVFFNSQYDLVVGDGRLHWIAMAAGETAVTEVRSVALDGGPVSARRVPGTFALSAWPWLVSASGSADAAQPMELVNLLDDRRVRVPSVATELVGCSPAWCRALVLGPDGGAARIEVMRPDGAERRRIAGGSVSAALSDVALLDRFEVLTRGRERQGGAAQLAVYDLGDAATTVVADGIGTVSARQGVLWWSTGEAQPEQWFALDLRALR